MRRVVSKISMTNSTKAKKVNEKAYYVYMLECADTSLYTGITTDVVRRISEHNGEAKGGAKYTRVKRPVKLVYSEEFPSRSLALKREHAIKCLTHIEKKKLTGAQPI